MTMEQTRVTATIEEVAAEAGVSRSTVSRVVNGSSAVSPEAKEAVEKAILLLNYVPNRAARSLASRATMAIALIVPEDTSRFFGDPFFASITAGIAERLRETDYVLNLFIASDDPGDKTAAYIRSGALDGAIVVSHHTSDTFLERIVSSVPVVFGGRPFGNRADDYYIDVDNVTGSRIAGEHLISRGCTRLATITGPTTMAVTHDRLLGLQQAATAAGLDDVLQACGDFSEVGGAQAMEELLALGVPFDGLHVQSDLMAKGAMLVLAREGVRVPDDIAIVGFDDSIVATSVVPPLTTMRQPSHEQGMLMADTLVRLLAHESVPHATMLSAELVVRGTA